MGSISCEIDDPNAPEQPVWYTGDELNAFMDDVVGCWPPPEEGGKGTPDMFMLRVFANPWGDGWMAEACNLIPEHARPT